jgi:hypothetical protein
MKNKRLFPLLFAMILLAVIVMYKYGTANACPEVTINNMQSEYCATTCGQKVCQRHITFCIPGPGTCFDCPVTYTIYKASDNSFVSSTTSLTNGGCGTISAPNVGNYYVIAEVCTLQSQAYYFSTVSGC